MMFLLLGNTLGGIEMVLGKGYGLSREVAPPPRPKMCAPPDQPRSVAAQRREMVLPLW